MISTMLHSSLLATLTCAVLLLAGGAEAQRWKAWRADLDYLYKEIEKPSALKQIFKQKGIKWKAIRASADKQFKAAEKASKKRRKGDQRSDEVAFYGVLRYLIGQLRDSHAYITVDDEIKAAFEAAQPPEFEAGIEFLRGTYGKILVANTFAARGANSPLMKRGIKHQATLLESVNGEPAARYFAKRAREKLEQEGWQSTYQRAHVEALNDLTMRKRESLELIFKTLDASDKSRKAYLKLSGKKQVKAFNKLKWSTKKIKLRANECTKSKNARNFRFLALEFPKLTQTPDLGYGRLPSGTGYIRWWKVSDKTRQALEEACAALEDCPGMIVDLRGNGGGGNSGIGVFDKKKGPWKKRVALLLGPKAMSQAETELLTLLRMRKNHRVDARLFGRPTAGSSGDKVRFELPSGFAKGQFVYRHWNEKIEGIGIEPDEVVDQDLVELSLGIDSCIRAAEAWLAAK